MDKSPAEHTALRGFCRLCGTKKCPPQGGLAGFFQDAEPSQALTRQLPRRGELNSLRQSAKFVCSEVTPSVIAYGDATFPKGTAFGNSGKVFGTARRRPLP